MCIRDSYLYPVIQFKIVCKKILTKRLLLFVAANRRLHITVRINVKKKNWKNNPREGKEFVREL